ncbi:uncharacterized protein LOC121941750 isoform X2 [Plectropomus leopardus]|uniref:uncharacterized protein LOC121941750 isoform X2 n=1 Tax=Plectropomus leopardus TaxID=160734 RepID=UPI001C4C7CD6|nr:uncharacterized protein LOC121941750 isoform X2 [Plectropomus leopardus]
MSRRRCILHCDRKFPLNGLPKEEEVRNQWLKFIFNTIPQQYNPNLLLCSIHFTEDCFTNLEQFNSGYSKRLRLKDGAVPTKLDTSGEPGSQPDVCAKRLAAFKIHHVGCQTSSPQAVSVGTQFMVSQKMVGTQLSWGTLTERHVRSKGTQTDFQPSSTSARVEGVRLSKRPRLELEERDGDATFNPSGSVVTEESKTWFEQRSAYGDTKYIVFESCLSELFDTCPVCKTKCDVQRRRMGTFVAFSQLCQNCDYSRQWQSQPVVGSTPVGNLQLSAATYFTGASFFQLEKICKAMQLQIFQYDTFRRYATSFLEPAIIHKWKTDQQSFFKQLPLKVAVGGDMQVDSPGHLAKYGSYSLMHLESNTIMDLQLVQSNEVGGSFHIEKEGLKRSLDLLESNDLSVDYIVTDRRPEIQEFLSERNITQFYDMWRFEKGLSKKLDKLAQNKDCEVLKKWLHSIKNHLYWTATSSTSGPEKVAKWTSLVNHIQNIHVHEDPIFPKCEHTDRVSRDPKKWFQPGSEALNKVKKILNNEGVLRDVEKLSHHHQKSSLEAFHSLIQRFTPKNAVYSFTERLCRLYLAVMHYNENVECKQASAGHAECTTKPVKRDPAYNYVDDLMKLVFDEVLDDPTPFVEELKKIPIPEDLPSQYVTCR